MTNLRIFTGGAGRKGRDKKEIWSCNNCGSALMKIVRYNDEAEILIECVQCETPMDLSNEDGTIANPPEAGE